MYEDEATSLRLLAQAYVISTQQAAEISKLKEENDSLRHIAGRALEYMERAAYNTSTGVRLLKEI